MIAGASFFSKIQAKAPSAVMTTRKGLILLTGDVGTGNTIFLNYLAETCRDQVLTSRLINPDLHKLCGDSGVRSGLSFSHRGR